MIDSPAPWRWTFSEHTGEWHLKDADEVSVDGIGAICPGEATRELIRLAPEMEQALRYFVELDEGMPDEQAKAADLLARLDAIRVKSI